MADPRIVSGAAQEGDLQFEAGLRPRRLKDFHGQPKLKELLSRLHDIRITEGEVPRQAPPSLGWGLEYLPITFTPALANSDASAVKSCASRVQPEVSSLG